MSPTKGISDILECGDRLIDYHGTESLTLTIEIDTITNIHINASINDAVPDKLIITDFASNSVIGVDGDLVLDSDQLVNGQITLYDVNPGIYSVVIAGLMTHIIFDFAESANLKVIW